MKILVVDDNKALREILVENLRSVFSGAEFMEASTGYEAKTKLNELTEAEWPDIVVTDYEMPGMNGLELTQEIRDELIPALSKTPVVVISGIMDSATLEANVRRLDGFFLKKPFRIADLAAIIRKLLN
jgi:CheY-like chemotaxis protein